MSASGSSEGDSDATHDLSSSVGGRPAWSVFRAELEACGFRPSRRFGQNFLLDENMVRAIVRDAAVAPGEFVLEVGAGCGFLSLHLLRAGTELVSVEIDPRLAEIASKLLANEARWRLVVCDVLAGKHALAEPVIAALPSDRPWHFVSNLPYSVAGPVLVCASELPVPPASMTVLVQREMALRIAARPGSDDWGPLSIRLQLDYEPKRMRDVPAALFWPRPSVESSVVRLVRRTPARPRAESDAVSALVDVLFQRRRQTLLRVLGELLGDRDAARVWLERCAVDPALRAESLDLEILTRLAAVDPRRS